MKSAKPPPADASSHRRSQPVRQTRTNPPRSSTNPARNAGNREALGNGPAGDQPIDIFPAITFFADTMTALPKELVRHFTLLREVDAKLCGPEEQLFKLVAAATNAPYPESRLLNETSSVVAPVSTPMSAQNSSSGIAAPGSAPLPPPSSAESVGTASSVFDPSNFPRRQLFRQTAFKIQEMLVALEEKNHVINTANEALQKQLTRIEDVWPYLENEFSDEAKWGSAAHWAYPENRTGKASHHERARRDGAAVISAAAQALADEAAARSDARKQAVQAKKSAKNQHQDSDFDDHEHRNSKGETGKKTTSKVRKTTESNSVGLGISGSGPTTNGNHPSKKRKVENISNESALPTERAMSTVFGNNASRSKASSANESPAPEGPKKRKALPTGSTQSKKKNGVTASPSMASSPVLSSLPEPKGPARASPAPNSSTRPATSRARQNSLHSGPENNKGRSALSTANKVNGAQPEVPEPAPSSVPARDSSNDPKSVKEPTTAAKGDPAKKEIEKPEIRTTPPVVAPRKETKAEERERRKSESLPPGAQSVPMVTTKSGRASKPSTPALATLQEPPRPRSSRNTESNGKKGHRKTNSTAHLAPPAVDDELTSGEGEIDADEPTYCYCNGVSYGEMVACDADECEREWFHLACVGLRVAPAEKSKWYCEDCKERLKIGNKKGNGR